MLTKNTNKNKKNKIKLYSDHKHNRVALGRVRRLIKAHYVRKYKKWKGGHNFATCSFDKLFYNVKSSIQCDSLLFFFYCPANRVMVMLLDTCFTDNNCETCGTMI